MDNATLRAVIENIQPQVDCGRFAVKRCVGEDLMVSADIFTDGHDRLECELLWQAPGEREWRHVPMSALGNDRWEGSFTPDRVGEYLYTVRAAVLSAYAWQRELNPPRHFITASNPVAETGFYRLQVDRERARFSSWYEMFPRSTGSRPGIHGTFRDCEARLPYIAQMGFDVLYLPPIHPIGAAFRKGPNNALHATPEDPGSPWAIGAAAGGHKAIHPALGTPEDFRRLVTAANRAGIEIALDMAFQASPEHPYVREHPEWFLHRPDGSIQYAENPPKKYQDIYPFHFEGEAWCELWQELKSIVAHWIAHGVRIFRVDNPHTKPFAMWQWLIEEIRREHPEVLFLAEAFTRPKVMYRLAKLGFTQSYTYFTWRNTKQELIEYFTELTRAPVSDFFRPNLWPNTPDILNEFLQFGGRPAFKLRLALAATLSANFGIYGPAFELGEHEPREPGSEEYRDSEKYQLRHWDLSQPHSLVDFITRINRIRRENPALQHDRGLTFQRIDNELLLAYSKTGPGNADAVLTIVNLDPQHAQSGWLELDLAALGLSDTEPFQAHDLLSGSRFLWKGPRNFVALDPAHAPAHIFRIRRKVRTERDFDYFL